MDWNVFELSGVYRLNVIYKETLEHNTSKTQQYITIYVNHVCSIFPLLCVVGNDNEPQVSG